MTPPAGLHGEAFACCSVPLLLIKTCIRVDSAAFSLQEWVETERACYLIRQHVYANLSHRLGTRPFLSHLEKVGRPSPSYDASQT